MDGFVLPAWRGIEEAMQDVKVVARDQHLERMVVLLPDGTRTHDVMGDAMGVDFEGDLTRNSFIVHGHPWAPCELSDADLKAITISGAAGNMAVCSEDDTVSWTSGIVAEVRKNDAMSCFMADRFTKSTSAHFTKLLGAPNCKWPSEPPNIDERWVVLAHLCNQHFLKSGFLEDYYLKIGEKEKEILAKWLVSVAK